jgi:4-hydroxy-tetrahydrodipicolinate reductase
VIRVCFAGVTGWTAPPIVAAIDAADDLALVSGVSRSAAGRRLADVTASGSAGPVHATVAEALASVEADVLVDYTSAAAVKDDVETAVRAGVHVVVGSSGLTAGDYADLDRLAREHGVGVIASGNFSVMAAVLQRAATLAAGHVGHWEVVDYAAATKPDVPSGTARELAERLAEVRAPVLGRPLDEIHGPREARGATTGGAQVHSIRLPSFVVSTEIVFGLPDERLVIRHDAGGTPAPYVAGTLIAARRARDRVGLTRGLDTLLLEQPHTR